jgi:glutamine amidotransferase
LLKGSVRRFDNELVVPHVGWNQVSQLTPHPLFENIPQESFFYFVHSYYCEPGNESTSIGATDYGARFASVVGEGNICGVQFHPEKSQSAGLQLLKNFASGQA